MSRACLGCLMLSTLRVDAGAVSRHRTVQAHTLELLAKNTISVRPNCGPARRCRVPTTQAAVAPVINIVVYVTLKRNAAAFEFCTAKGESRPDGDRDLFR